jgi:predicted RNase H-like HicB family nuclease
MQTKTKKTYNYTIIFEKEAEGGYHAFCPSLKGCHSQGDSFEETLANITEAVELYIESLLEDQEPLPEENLIIKPIRVTV